MSYHAPHTLSPTELEELERSESQDQEEGTASAGRFVVEHYDHDNAPAVKGPPSGKVEAKSFKPGEVWVVYDYDHQTTRYSNPLTAYSTKAEAMAHRKQVGMVGVHKLDVWPTVAAWETAGKPVWRDT